MIHKPVVEKKKWLEAIHGTVEQWNSEAMEKCVDTRRAQSYQLLCRSYELVANSEMNIF